MYRRQRFGILVLIAGVIISTGSAHAAPKSKTEPVQLTESGQKLSAKYAKLLEDLKAEIAKALPSIDLAKKTAFLEAHDAETQRMVTKTVKKREVQAKVGGGPKDFEKAIEAARPLLNDLDDFLGSDKLDRSLFKCAVLASATPKALAAFAQQGPAEEGLVDELLANDELMKRMVYAGGAKAGRYGKAMQIYRAIQAQSDKARSGILERLAFGTSLEFAAPEMCQLADIDPVKRYLTFEKEYLDGELDPAFKEMTDWECRYITNDPHPDEEMLWLKQMLKNYRPDYIATPAYRWRYAGIIENEVPHKQPEEFAGLNLTGFQRTFNGGSLCGPKAFAGRCITRAFGIPVWGMRLKSHTAMGHWTPDGWTTNLGVSWNNGFWSADTAEPMRGWFFKLGADAREYPAEYIKAVRAQCVGLALGEEKIDGMNPRETGGLWNVLAMKKLELITKDANPKAEENKPVANDPIAKAEKEKEGKPEYVMKPVVAAADKKIIVDTGGVITIPAVACVTPTNNTDKIVFMASDLGGMQLHYKRYCEPEAFVYECEVPAAGKYKLTAKVVTITSDQNLLLTVNQAKAPIDMALPYTVGQWGESQPVEVSLVKGKNVLSFTRQVPSDFAKVAWHNFGPMYGGITIKQFTLTPVTL